jgi:hypothetical protein
VRDLTTDAGAALLAAAMTAVGLPAICGLRFAVLSDSLGLSLVIGAVLASTAANAQRSAPLAAGAGLLWGLAALARTQYLPLGPAALLLFLFLGAKDARLRSGGVLGRGLALLAGWLLPVALYYGLLSLHQRGVTVPNAYDVPYVLTPSMERVYRVIHAFVSPMVTGLPLLLLAGLLFLRPPRPQISSLGPAVERVLLWLLMAGALSSLVAVVARTERRYFLVAHWCVWVLAGLTYAARSSQLNPKSKIQNPKSLERWVLGCLVLATASYPVYALQQHDEWPMPTPAYAAASRWINATFGRSPRVAVTGDAMTVLYEVDTTAVVSIQHALTSDWSALERWLSAEKPDVVLIGPDPGAERHPMSPVYQALLANPASGRRLGLTHARSFAAPEGTVHAFLPADRSLIRHSSVKTGRGNVSPTAGVQ